MAEIKCPKCEYEWKSKSKLKMVTCPSCQLKVLRIEIQEGTERRDKQDGKDNLL